MTALKAVYLIGGPRHGCRSLAGGVATQDLLDRCTLVGHDDDGELYQYTIIGQTDNGELLAVEV